MTRTSEKPLLPRLPFEVVLANDIDKKALNTYSKNFGTEHIICKDVRELDTKELPKQYDLLLGGFPCSIFQHSKSN